MCVVKISQLAPAKEEEEAVVLEYSLVAGRGANENLPAHAHKYIFLFARLVLNNFEGWRRASEREEAAAVKLIFHSPHLGRGMSEKSICHAERDMDRVECWCAPRTGQLMLWFASEGYGGRLHSDRS